MQPSRALSLLLPTQSETTTGAASVENIVQGLKDGIAGMWDNIKDWFNEKVNSLVGGVKRILGIHSPSKVFAGIGGFMAEGLGEGFSDEFAAVKNDIEGSMNLTLEPLQQMQTSAETIQVALTERQAQAGVAIPAEL